MNRVLYLLVAFCSFWAQGQFIPAPDNVSYQEGSFVLDNSTGVVLEKISNDEGKALVQYLSKKIEDETAVKISQKKTTQKNIVFELTERADKELEDEGYKLKISSSEIRITANFRAGLFYGVQSLLQYVYSNNTQQPIQLANLEVTDSPNVKWRGFVLDVSRHFYSVKTIKEMLDLMAFYKLNVFHWHLTDNEGWRLEIKKYPKLTSVGAWRKEIPGSVIYKPDSTYVKKLDGKPFIYGGYYSQDQVKEIVAYAQERNITVIPEIDMPGHSGAALTAYPEFSCEKHIQETPNSTLWNGVVNPLDVNLNYCAGQESTFEFLEDVLTEVLALFPSTYIHVGGDEVDKSYWEKCDKCQVRMKEEKLGDAHELQSYFIKRMARFLEENDRKLIGWDEILEGGAPKNAMVMSWRGEKGGIATAKLKQEVIMVPSNPLYFNRYQDDPENEPFAASFSINTLEKVYQYNIIPDVLSEEEKKYIKGAQFAIWTEFISSVEHLEYILLPRMPAFAENLWSKPQNKNYEDFISRLHKGHFEYWKRNGIRFHPKEYQKSIY
ncbi:hexosaminidase [Arenibacter nanhaiticus]|uniref:beta-N-acetylhexosaminidase n=1 Tax=Arenibacter nanhaiticus TaxID=558155 RepID=A0A1M6M7J9_9FLAO|nr:beta-N-acetylhexosaminidase [Arenibacter nanhaiticus]SHJ79427.1 hexosaminidase [Arenibacter nanhaiticus]